MRSHAPNSGIPARQPSTIPGRTEQNATRPRNSLLKQFAAILTGAMRDLGVASDPFFHKAPGRIPWEKVVELADQCLYAAKTNGRDTWVGVHAAERALLEALPQTDGAFLVPTLLEGGYLAVESRSEAPLVWPTAHP